MYFWKGIRVPKEWILNIDTITKNTIITEKNLERRRCIMEMIGLAKYYKLLDMVCIDQDLDQNNNTMMLFRTKEIDPAIEDFHYYLNVIDPSTSREYSISVPPSYDVHWAKMATFNNKKIQFRQGGVGLLNFEFDSDKPIIET